MDPLTSRRNTSKIEENSQFSEISLNKNTNINKNDDAVLNPEYLKAFSSLILDQLNTQDMNALLDSQDQIIKRLDQTNRILAKANHNSFDTYNSFALKDYQSYIQILTKMKNDLDFIFKRIRILKNKLELKYPTQYAKSFKVVQENNKNLGLDDLNEDEEEFNNENDLIKERTSSVGSNSSGSRLSTSKSVFANFFETARNRISPTVKESINDLTGTRNVTPTSFIQQQIIESKNEENFEEQEIKPDDKSSIPESNDELTSNN